VKVENDAEQAIALQNEGILWQLKKGAIKKCYRRPWLIGLAHKQAG
jgi:hypothetical protein